jgi:hypothetical protein
MLYKLLTLFLIIVFLTLILFIKNSRKPLRNTTSGNRRIFTFRGMVLLGAIILFLVFSLLR